MKRLILPLLAALVLPITVNALPNYKQWGVKTDSGGRHIRGERKKLTDAEQEALKALCKIGCDAALPRKWGNEDINAAIASIKWGTHWPDGAQATAYKTCDRGGFLD